MLGESTESGRGEGLAARLGGQSLHSPRAFLVCPVVGSHLAVPQYYISSTENKKLQIIFEILYY
jgi:hypothetical protein